MPRPSRVAVWSLPWVALACAGCAKGCKNDHPYVPYTIDGTSASQQEPFDAGASVPEPDAGNASAFIGRPALVAPPGQTEWAIDGVSLVAPEGKVFALGLVADLNGDDVADVLAVVRPADAERAPGELVFYRGKAAGELAAPELLPGPVELTDVPGDPSCTPTQRLALVGRRSAFVEIGLACAARKDSAASRWIGIVSGDDKGTKLRFAAEVFDPPSAPKLTIDASGTDADADGLDDVTLRLTVEGGGPPFEPGPKVSAIVRWLDRSAGLARDTSSLENSLAMLSATAMARAARVKDAPAVPLYVAQIRALYRAICAEGGAPRIVRRGGPSQSSCGQSRALEDAGIAEVRAHATLGDALRAITAFERAQRPPATRTASRTNDATGYITSAAPVVMASSYRIAAAVPQIERGKAPSWGALAFEPSGKLLVRTAAGVVRVDPEHGDEQLAEGVPPWKGAVRSPEGNARWIEAYNACDGVALRATFEMENDVKDLALPIAPPFGTRCTTSRGEPAPTLPIAWGPRGLEAVVAGVPVLMSPDLTRASVLATPLDQPVQPGAPRSPNGKLWVVPTSMGLVVKGEGKSMLARAADLEGAYAALRDCVVSDDGARVACVKNGRVWMGSWEPRGI